ncbi:phage tail tube protein [Streptomyces europaeiscabiei]|uniref:Phage tail tube protein n=1 Tax=Streptomyces europaeiscabiei TaxID=146819 RepID=A0ABU4N6U8_9ACTN|nr:phage tail tube protein [Streptomyces europaeiscabiei]MDX3550984.1 phage tail tube protein [Streptomyces europaeiscabiei]MDX3698456.1 phage tail tube protein [Streptomyces europaeiscabiei]
MSGVDAFGIALKRGDGATPTEVFTAIAKVTNVGGPEIERETYDVTAHDSLDGWREFIGGLKDGGEVSIEVNYDPRVHDDLVADFEDTEPRNYKITFPNGIGEWAVKLILTGFSQEAPVDDKLSAELTFKVSGKPAITEGV